MNLSSAVDIQDINIGIGDQLRKRSALSETLETYESSEFIQLNAEVKGTEAIRAFNQDDSQSILHKLFVNAPSLNSGNLTDVVEVIVEIIRISYQQCLEIQKMCVICQ